MPDPIHHDFPQQRVAAGTASTESSPYVRDSYQQAFARLLRDLKAG